MHLLDKRQAAPTINIKKNLTKKFKDLEKILCISHLTGKELRNYGEIKRQYCPMKQGNIPFYILNNK